MLGEEAVVDVFKRLGFTRLTQIQQQAISKIINSEMDIVVSAPTGSGKTEAVIIPLFSKISSQMHSERGILLIYVTPLRALNRDLAGRIKSMASLFNLSVEVWHGDTSYHLRRRIVENPPSVLLTTPESLQVLIVRRDFVKPLKHLYAIVVDELQEIISSERGSELIVSLERIDYIANRHVRRIAISSPLRDIHATAKHLFGYRRFEVVSAQTPKQYLIEVLLSDKKYREGVFEVDSTIGAIKNIIDTGNQTLIFTNTRVAAEEIGFALRRVLNLDSGVGVHHSSLSRDVREYTEKMFKRGELRIVISTSSLELGIDVGGVEFVVQYLSPRQAIKLLQRVGRAGHREEIASRGAILVPPILTELVESIVIARRAMNRVLEPIDVHTEPLDVLAHQIVGMAIERGSIKINDVIGVLTRTSIFSSLSTEKLKSVVDFLASVNLLKCRDYECSPTKRGLLYYLTTNMIPDTNHVEAKSVLNGEVIGVLDEDFAATCNEGDMIVLAGRAWKVESVELNDRVVWLSPPTASDIAILPKWVGDNIPVHRNVSREVCSFMRRLCDCSTDECLEELKREYSISNDVMRFFRENRERFCRVHPRDDLFTIELHNSNELNKSIIAFYHCLGTKGSEAFSLAVSSVFRNTLGVSTSYRAHQLGTIIVTGTQIKPTDITRALQSLLQYANSGGLKEVVSAELINTSIFKKRVVEVAKRFGVISRDSDLSEVRRITSALLNIPILLDEALRELFTERVDVKSLEKFLRELTVKKIRIISTQKASPFLLEISSLGSVGHIVKQSIMPREMLIEIAKRRLTHGIVRMLCSLCYDTVIVDISEYVSKCHNIFECHVVCPKCGSRAFIVIDDKPLDAVKSVLNKLRSAVSVSKLEPEERSLAERISREINFIIENGVAGLIALRGRGIGVETAKRILAKSVDLDSLIYNIVEQEKVFLRTRKYWESE